MCLALAYLRVPCDNARMEIATDEYRYWNPETGEMHGWAVARRDDGDGFDWMAYGNLARRGSPEFEFGACPGDESPDHAIEQAKMVHGLRFSR